MFVPIMASVLRWGTQNEPSQESGSLNHVPLSARKKLPNYATWIRNLNFGGREPLMRT